MEAKSRTRRVERDEPRAMNLTRLASPIRQTMHGRPELPRRKHHRLDARLDVGERAVEPVPVEKGDDVHVDGALDGEVECLIHQNLVQPVDPDLDVARVLVKWVVALLAM